MRSALEQFFGAWQETDAAARRAQLDAALASEVRYSDPRTENALCDLDAIADYVGQFSANAPGWSARLSALDEVDGHARAIVDFGGDGPDGQPISQRGTYFARADEQGRLTLLIGFVGTGA